MRHPRSSLLPRRRPEMTTRWLSALAFVFTCLSVFLVNLPRWPSGSGISLSSIASSALFTGLLMGILVSHELGHVVLARVHRFRVGPPWFIPFPWFVGTMGAVIVPSESPRNRTALAEMGAAGPLFGAVVVLVVLATSLILAEPGPVEPDELQLGTPLIWSLLNTLTGAGCSTPSASDPVAFAGWIGCLVTAMNLLPFGQLDGGHIFSALYPAWSRAAGRVVTGVLLLLGVFWMGWIAWIVALHVLGSSKPTAPRSVDVPPSTRARVFAVLCLIVFVLFAIPLPVGGG